MGYFRFFLTHSGLFNALYPTLCDKIYQKILYITIYEKSKKFYGYSVKEENARGKKTPAFLGLSNEK